MDELKETVKNVVAQKLEGVIKELEAIETMVGAPVPNFTFKAVLHNDRVVTFSIGDDK